MLMRRPRTLRPVTYSDIEWVSDLFKSSGYISGSGKYQFLRAIKSVGKNCFFECMFPFAFVFYRVRKDRCLVVYDIVVNSTYRGLGFGEMIINDLLFRYSSEIEKIRIKTSQAKGFWEKFGLQVVSEYYSETIKGKILVMERVLK